LNAPTVLHVWWNKNRNVIMLIPMIVGIIVTILWSSTLPLYEQDWVIGVGVAVAFGAPAILIAWGTVKAWQFSWFILEMEQLPENVYVPFVHLSDSRPLAGSRDRYATDVDSARTLDELAPLFQDAADFTGFKVRSKGTLGDRINLTGYGLVYFGGMPAIAHGVERLSVAPSVTASVGAEKGEYRRRPTFELRESGRGDYEMMTDPRVQDAMWDAWQEVLKERASPATAPAPEAAPGQKPALEAVQAYCIVCRSKREVRSPERTTTKSGKQGVSGICPVCGRRLFAIVKGGQA
jgi:hypothetical protein